MFEVEVRKQSQLSNQFEILTTNGAFSDAGNPLIKMSLLLCEHIT